MALDFGFLAWSLQTGFLAFTICASALILRTLLRGRRLLNSRVPSPRYEARIRVQGEDFTDEGPKSKFLIMEIDFPKVIPSSPLDHSAANQVQTEQIIQQIIGPEPDIVDDMLFTANSFTALNSCLQDIVDTKLRYSGWKTIVKAQGIDDFIAGTNDDGDSKPVVILKNVYSNGTNSPDDQKQILQVINDLVKGISGFWPNQVIVIYAGDDNNVAPTSTRRTVSPNSIWNSARNTANSLLDMSSLTSFIPWIEN